MPDIRTHLSTRSKFTWSVGSKAARRNPAPNASSRNLTGSSSRGSTTMSVRHGMPKSSRELATLKSNYEALEKVGRGGKDTIQELLRQRCLNLPVCHPHDLVWCLRLPRTCWFYRKLILRRGLARLFDKLSEFVKLLEKVAIVLDARLALV